MATSEPTREQITKTFGRDAADFVEHASLLGWRILYNSTGTSITLIPWNDGPKRIHLSSKNKNSGALRKHYKTLMRYANMDRVRELDGLIKSDIPEDAKVLAFELLADFTEIEVMEPEEPKPVHKRAPKKVTHPTPPKPQEAVVPAIPTPTQIAERVTQERRILSERPAMMHYSLTQTGGKSYPSKTTIERRWSDGTVDYACAVTTCESTSENRRAFGGAHWAMHVRKGEAQPYDEEEAKRTVVDDPEYTEHAWTRKQNLRSKRTAELTKLLQGIDLSKITPEDLAEQILDFLGDMGGGGGGGSEPLTDAQVLDRIRSLVDRGTYADQEKAIYERDRQIEDLMQYSQTRETELAEKLLEAEQRATKAEATMNAFFDLVQEMKPGEAN